MAKTAAEREAARAARQSLKVAFAAAGKPRPSDKQLDKAAQKAINQLNNKQQTQSFISEIIADGRVTAEEADKAQNQGVSLARIQKAQTKSFLPGNVFSMPGTSKTTNARQDAIGTTPAQPAYSPLVIQGAAQKVFDQGRAVAAAPAPAPVQQQQPITTNPDDERKEEEFYDPFADFMKNTFPQLLEALKPEPYEPLPPPTTYASIGQAAQSAPGVKARRSSASLSQQTSLGTRGSFNRGGLRISNLNI